MSIAEQIAGEVQGFLDLSYRFLTLPDATARHTSLEADAAGARP